MTFLLRPATSRETQVRPWRHDTAGPSAALRGMSYTEAFMVSLSGSRGGGSLVVRLCRVLDAGGASDSGAKDVNKLPAGHSARRAALLSCIS